MEQKIKNIIYVEGTKEYEDRHNSSWLNDFGKYLNNIITINFKIVFNKRWIESFAEYIILNKNLYLDEQCFSVLECNSLIILNVSKFIEDNPRFNRFIKIKEATIKDSFLESLNDDLDIVAPKSLIDDSYYKNIAQDFLKMYKGNLSDFEAFLKRSISIFTKRFGPEYTEDLLFDNGEKTLKHPAILKIVKESNEDVYLYLKYFIALIRSVIKVLYLLQCVNIRVEKTNEMISGIC